ncbi:MAG: hypothetical protein LUO98_05685 [Methanoregula sp.]|jgi:hypothetical protein|nr:hypothetical protein [Methanoregula sp.]
MDSGKIMIGIALVMLSIGLLVSPSGATGFDHSCTVGCGNAFSPADTMVTPYSPLGREYPAGYHGQIFGNTDHGSAP